MESALFFLPRHAPLLLYMLSSAQEYAIYGSTALVELGGLFTFLIYTQSIGFLGRWIVRQLPTHRTAQTQNKHTQTSMPRVGFELTIPVFEQAKTSRPATVIGDFDDMDPLNKHRNA
jgi:hypothetical protein